MECKKISYEIKDGYAYVGFGALQDRKITVLDLETFSELGDLLIHITKEQSKLRGLIFFSHTEDVFLAGADIKMFDNFESRAEVYEKTREGQIIYSMIEDLQIPTVACIDGACMGGGVELALACKIILATDNKKTLFALPEVKLGLLPALGGCYRLQKRVTLPDALDMLLTGKNIYAKKAKKMGLVDQLYPKELILKYAVEIIKRKHHTSKSFIASILSSKIVRKIIIEKARDTLLKKTKGFYEAPLKILSVVEHFSVSNRDDCLEEEAKIFADLLLGEQSKNLRNIFFLNEAAKKCSVDLAPLPLKRALVLGAGTMGGGIAWLLAKAGLRPLMKDITLSALELGLKQSSQIFYKDVKRKILKHDEFVQIQRSIIPTLDYSCVKPVDLVIEAVVEKMDIKKEVLAELENHLKETAIITSNTSSLSISEIATALHHPERFAGLHFFNPVHKMPLVEIITHDKIAPLTIKTLHDFVVRTGKVPVIVKDGPGFLVNRILASFLNEAMYLLEFGVPLKKIEDAALEFGMPMGPCRLMDEIGIDVAVKVGHILEQELGSRFKPSEMGAKLIEANLLGKKSKAGFYLYDDAGIERGINKSAESLSKSTVDISDEEIAARLIYPMINEATRILDSKIVASPQEIDLALIFGIGFPPFRGGLMRFADDLGLEEIVRALEDLAKRVDVERFQPSYPLLKMSTSNMKFYHS